MATFTLSGADSLWIRYFWSVFGSLPPNRQRRLLAFCTASDRIPATGISSLQLRLQCLGNDSDRLPQSHTCFNTLSMWRYGTRDKVEKMLVRAMEDRCAALPQNLSSARSEFRRLTDFSCTPARALDCDRRRGASGRTRECTTRLRAALLSHLCIEASIHIAPR